MRNTWALHRLTLPSRKIQMLVLAADRHAHTRALSVFFPSSHLAKIFFTHTPAHAVRIERCWTPAALLTDSTMGKILSQKRNFLSKQLSTPVSVPVWCHLCACSESDKVSGSHPNRLVSIWTNTLTIHLYALPDHPGDPPTPPWFRLCVI